MPAGRVLVVILVSLLVWTVLYAPTMKRAAEASPLGVRRTVSLAVLRPIAAVSDWIGLERAGGHHRARRGEGSGQTGRRVRPTPRGHPAHAERRRTIPTATAGTATATARRPRPIPSARRHPSRKLRVAIVGDSLAAGLGYFAERVFLPRLVRVSGQGRISTGLARPDYFNWPYTMRRIVDRFDPDLVIVMLGENDHQSLQDGARRPRGADRDLRMAARLPRAGAQDDADRDLARSEGRVGRTPHLRRLPAPGAFEAAERDLRVRREHLQRRRLLRRMGALPRAAGGYTAYFREGRRVILIREGDGLHFNAVGYTILAREIAKLAVEEFGLSPRTFQTAI